VLRLNYASGGGSGLFTAGSSASMSGFQCTIPINASDVAGGCMTNTVIIRDGEI
jgi:hypothetical protein